MNFPTKNRFKYNPFNSLKQAKKNFHNWIWLSKVIDILVSIANYIWIHFSLITLTWLPHGSRKECTLKANKLQINLIPRQESTHSWTLVSVFFDDAEFSGVDFEPLAKSSFWPKFLNSKKNYLKLKNKV